MNPIRRGSVTDYDGLLADVVHVINEARSSVVRAVNVAMTITYWLIGCRIIEEEQRGAARADYGEQLAKRLAQDLSRRFGRGFSKRNLWQMRAFYLAWPLLKSASPKQPSSPTFAGGDGIVQTASAQLVAALARDCARRFPLPWFLYVRLLAVRSELSRGFYEREALRGGWTISQLDRQIQTQFYERTALSRDKAALLSESDRLHTGGIPTPEEGLSNTALAAEYRTTLPQERLLAEEIARTRRQLDLRRQVARRRLQRLQRAGSSRSRRSSSRGIAGSLKAARGQP